MLSDQFLHPRFADDFGLVAVGGIIEAQNDGRQGDQAGVLSLHFFNAAVYDKAWQYSRTAAEHAAMAPAAARVVA